QSQALLCMASTPTTPASFAPLARNAELNWTVQDILDLYELPLLDLLLRAQNEHRQHHEPNAVQLSSLLSIKTGGCPEDCSYCPQSSRYDTEVDSEAPMPMEQVLDAARAAKESGAQRFCMCAAWRSPTARQLDSV